MENTPLVIYHRNCTDGFAAAFAAWLVYGPQAEYLACQYDEIKQLDDLPNITGREVFILDFSFPKDIMLGIISIADNVVWLDHHKTAFEAWCPGQGVELYKETGDNYAIQLNNNKCGAMLAWEYFHPGTEVPMLYRHVDDYDRWQFKLTHTKEIQSAIRAIPFDFKTWEDWMRYPVAQLQALTEQGIAIESYRKNVVSGIAKHPAKVTISVRDNEAGYLFEGLAANCTPAFTSDVGHELSVQSGTFGLCYVISDDKTVNCSLRSNGDYDVSAIAKLLGGGGHKNAAGFRTDIETLTDWLG